MGGTLVNGSGTKSGTTGTNTGAPAWASGAEGGNSMMANPAGPQAAQQPAIQPAQPSSYVPPAPQPPATGTAAGGTGVAPTPGTDEYNTMNTQLQTSPMQALVNLFQNGGQNGQSMQVLQNLMGSTGTNPMMDQAGDMFKSLFSGAEGPGANEQYLTNYANGSMVGKNPYVDAIANKAEQDAATNVNQMFAAGGRYGSGMDQGTVAEAVANANNQYRGQAYENDAARQLAASGAISQEQIGRMGVKGNAASGLGGLGQSGMSNWLQAQSGAGQLGSQGIQNMLNGMGQLGNVQNNKMFDSTQQTNVGNQTTAQTQQQINDMINQWTQGDMSDWARTGALLSSGTGAAGNWGTASGSQKTGSQAGIASILGGILGLF